LGGGVLEGGDLGVVAEVVEVFAFADDLVVVDEDAADGGVGRGEGGSGLGESEGVLEVEIVLRRERHADNRIAVWKLGVRE
jgi:hypothetical protein